MCMKVKKIRSVVKTISWRIVGTMDTMFLGWLITGDPLLGLKIGALELITKFVLYYIHVPQPLSISITLEAFFAPRHIRTPTKLTAFSKLILQFSFCTIFAI